MKNYSDLLNMISELKNDKGSSIQKRGLLINLLTMCIKTLENSLKYEKLKIKRHKLGDLDFKIDICESDDLLFSVFGSDDMAENDKKLKELKESLKDLKNKKSN